MKLSWFIPAVALLLSSSARADVLTYTFESLLTTTTSGTFAVLPPSAIFEGTITIDLDAAIPGQSLGSPSGPSYFQLQSATGTNYSLPPSPFLLTVSGNIYSPTSGQILATVNAPSPSSFSNESIISGYVSNGVSAYSATQQFVSGPATANYQLLESAVGFSSTSAKAYSAEGAPLFSTASGPISVSYDEINVTVAPDGTYTDVDNFFDSSVVEISNPTVTTTPIPPSDWLMLSGLIALGAFARKRGH